ncbi:MAG TPA: protein-glutamate O-methyltransferase CheR [Solirubrobacterales bacterium]|jgi:chemotaxis protein methyltransferase CheR|nr:protein-glutamate O-methyltransferase CheR [Solirubrobacterales bacterium]
MPDQNGLTRRNIEPPPRGDFEAFCEGVKDLIGVDLARYKRNQMERRARGLASRHGDRTLMEYLELLRTDSHQLDRFMERMTITVSQLWRNTDIFNAIEKELLPELNERAGVRRLNIWSAGCSYGAEPHTLAVICLEISHKLNRIPKIKGTDINPRMIERARRGHFSEEDIRDAPPLLLNKYFSREDGGWRANEDVRQMIRFKVEDLFAAKTDAVDLILFRNVAIHFDKESRERVHQILADALMPGGMLVLGSTEMIAKPSDLGLERVRPFIFRKLDDR